MDPQDPCTVLLTADPADGSPVLVVAGELDLVGAALVRSCVDQLRTAGKCRATIDLAAVTFLDAAGVGALIEARQRLDEDGGSLTVRDPSPFATRVLEWTRTAATLGVDTTASAGTVEQDPDRPAD